MTKSVRFLIVFIVFLALILFSRRNDSQGVIAGKATTVFRAESTTVADSTDNSALRKNLVLLEFFSGL